MKVYIQADKRGMPYNVNAYCAMQGFEQMIARYKQAPAGYALDIGVTKQDDTIIVEVNDGYSLGSYGLDPLLYAKLLFARWAELTI